MLIEVCVDNIESVYTAQSAVQIELSCAARWRWAELRQLRFD